MHISRAHIFRFARVPLANFVMEIREGMGNTISIYTGIVSALRLRFVVCARANFGIELLAYKLFRV